MAAPFTAVARRGAAACALSLLLVLSAAGAARAACAPIRVIVAGTVIEKGYDLPLTDYPIAIRMESLRGATPSLSWDAVVTDDDGRFRWTHEFPADPCHQGILGRLRGLVWGWTVKILSRAYHRGAEGLPERITLNAGPRLMPIERAELLDKLDKKTRTVEIDVFLTL